MKALTDVCCVAIFIFFVNYLSLVLNNNRNPTFFFFFLILQNA